MSIPVTQPDMHRIAMVYVDPTQGVIVRRGSDIYSRIRVTHLGGRAAENAEILVASLHEYLMGQRVFVRTFLPMSLRWSHFQPPTATVRVPRRAFRHCDLGHFTYDVETQTTIFVFDTIVMPNPVGSGAGELPNVLKAGIYEVDLILTGDNVRVERGTWRIEFPPEWSEDEDQMLERIRIERVGHQLSSPA